MLAKKLLYPFISAVILLSLLVFGIVYGAGDLYSSDLVYAVIALLLTVLFTVVGIPFLSFVYGLKFLRQSRKKFIFVLYNALITAFTYIIMFAFEDETYIYGAVLFGWCALWSLLPLLFPVKKKT